PNMVTDQPLRQGEVVLVPVKESSLKASAAREPKANTSVRKQEPTAHESVSYARAYWVYTVQSGDTLTSIAQRFGISTYALAYANNLSPNASLMAGQVLIVPVLEQKIETKVSQKSSTTSSTQSAPKAQKVSTRQTPVLPAPRIFGYVGTVIASIANIHSAPRESSSVWSRVVRGTQVIITSERPGWYGVLMVNGSTGWVKQNALRKGSRPIFWDDIMKAFGGQTRYDNNAIVAEALCYLGVPYKYGGTSPVKGLDCSAFVQRVFAARGIKLPRTSAKQAEVGIPVPVSQLQPGDRLYFAVKGNRIDHCGIYIGNGLFIHASGRHNAVVISSLYEPLYARSLVTIRR
ncbi:MAG: C40 family peptidase, partial [Candidatus Fervidibacter sp.]|uniref:C40 family peptidase n=2 Tax=Candidatus Fervidibacter sp. TaxID=3100871 RepID=UPI00404B9158